MLQCLIVTFQLLDLLMPADQLLFQLILLIPQSRLGLALVVEGVAKGGRGLALALGVLMGDDGSLFGLLHKHLRLGSTFVLNPESQADGGQYCCKQ